MILGLDISTSITGATIVDRRGALIYCKAWRTDKKGLSFYRKVDMIKEHILFLKTQYPIEKIYVEEPLNMFRAGKSSAQTISLIQRFNGVVCWIVREAFEIEPYYINPSSARKQCGIKTQKGQKAKERALQYVIENEKDFKIEYTKHGNPVKGTYDRSDSWVVAQAGHYLWKKEKYEKEKDQKIAQKKYQSG